jgi:hypothetical protein
MDPYEGSVDIDKSIIILFVTLCLLHVGSHWPPRLSVL